MLHNKTFETGISDTLEIITKTRWKWSGHVTRMNDNRWTVRCTEWQVRNGKEQEEDQEEDGAMTYNSDKRQLGPGQQRTGNNGET